MGRETICPKTGLKKGPWTQEEDRILTDYITIYGHGNWCDLPKNAGISRCRKSCRLRWLNYLQPNIKRGDFTKEEEELIMKMQEEHGNRWTLIAASLPGRTDNEIKNFWYSQDNKRKKLIKKALKGSKRKLVKKRSLVNGRPLILESSLVCPVSSPESTDISSPRINDSETLSDVSPRIDDREILSDGFVELDESFWEEVFKGTDASTTVENGSLLADSTLMLPLSPVEEAFDFYDVYSDAYDMDMLFNDLEFVENRQ